MELDGDESTHPAAPSIDPSSNLLLQLPGQSPGRSHLWKVLEYAGNDGRLAAAATGKPLLIQVEEFCQNELGAMQMDHPVDPDWQYQVGMLAMADLSRHVSSARQLPHRIPTPPPRRLLLSAAMRTPLYKLASTSHASAFHVVAQEEEENTLACGHMDGSILLWDMSTKQCLRRFYELPGPVLKLDSAPGGGHVISSSASPDGGGWMGPNVLRVWSLQDGTCKHSHTVSCKTCIAAFNQTVYFTNRDQERAGRLCIGTMDLSSFLGGQQQQVVVEIQNHSHQWKSSHPPKASVDDTLLASDRWLFVLYQSKDGECCTHHHCDVLSRSDFTLHRSFDGRYDTMRFDRDANVMVANKVLSAGLDIICASSVTLLRSIQLRSIQFGCRLYYPFLNFGVGSRLYLGHYKKLDVVSLVNEENEKTICFHDREDLCALATNGRELLCRMTNGEIRASPL